MNTFSRRAALGAFAAASATVGLPAPGSAQSTSTVSAADAARQALKSASGTKLVLLGTGGGPVPGRTRRMTGHVLVHGDAAYVIDCGMGTTDRFAEAGLSFANVRSIFLTHHHPDHNVEYGPFLLIGWVQGLRPSVTAYGPPPLTQMTHDYLTAMGTTIDFWAKDFHMNALAHVETHDLPSAGLVMHDDLVTVRSVLVQHPPVNPAYGYRFDFPDRSIAFSGDTVPVEALARLASGADVLVHEAMSVQAMETYVRRAVAAGRPTTVEAFMNHMLADHSALKDVGRIAHEAGVKTLVLSHLTPALNSITDEEWRAPVAAAFSGKIIVGRDLMVI